MAVDLSKDLISWGNVLDAINGISEVTGQIEAAKEGLQCVLDVSLNIDLQSIPFQQGKLRLQKSLAKVVVLCGLGVPLREQHQKVEGCFRKFIATGEITSGDVQQIESELQEAMKVCTDYERRLEQFSVDMEKARELISTAIHACEREMESAGAEAANARWKGSGLASALAGLATILGVSCALLAPPTAVAAVASFCAAGCAAATVIAADALLSSRTLDVRAQRFRESAATLKSSVTEMQSLMEKVRAKPVTLSAELKGSLQHVLGMYKKYSDKEREAEQLTLSNINLARRNDHLQMREQQHEAEIERLRRKVSRLESNERNTD